MSQPRTMFCTGCRADSEFEQPVCGDGHGRDCPDLVCVVCGLALYAFVADDLLLEDVRTAGPRSAVA